MHGFVDLHCHWIAAIDDGAPTPDEGTQMLRDLHAVGFSTVVATPHMRPGMFDNDAAALARAFQAMGPSLEQARAAGPLPEVHLGSEHFLDDIVFQRLTRGEALPYPGGGAVLIEFPRDAFPARVAHRFVDLHRCGLTPVLAHPERYMPVWDDDGCLDPLMDAGALMLLDICALVGKYGRRAQAAAEKLLEEEAYEAACSDSHRAKDVEITARAIQRLQALAGQDEARRLLAEAPQRILSLPGGATHAVGVV